MATKEKATKEHTRVFEFEKSTKNTHRYQEQMEEGQLLVIGNLYVQKVAVGIQPPDIIEVIVRVL